MDMKYDCELIQDILPLYEDDVLSDKSKEIISEHLSECTVCKKLYEQSDLGKKERVSDNNIQENNKVVSYSKRIKRLRVLIAAGVLLVIVLLSSAFFSYVKLNTANPFSAGIGLVRIMVTDTEYVEIQSSPRVVVAKPDNAWQLFLDTIKSEGYTYLEDERMGSLCTIEKGGNKERVFFSANGYFSKWEWEQ
jgi:hypothetical protein